MTGVAKRPRVPLEKQVESRLARWLHAFLGWLDKPDLTERNRELVVGTLAYLLEESDLVPDDVPHIGLLDDLMVFVLVATQLAATARVDEPFDFSQLEDDRRFVQKHESLLFGVPAQNVDAIRRLGRGRTDVAALVATVRERYAALLGIVGHG